MCEAIEKWIKILHVICEFHAHSVMQSKMFLPKASQDGVVGDKKSIWKLMGGKTKPLSA